MQRFILLLFLLIPFVMNSQTYFTDGMKWCTQIIGTQDPSASATIEVVTIERAIDDDSFNMYRYYDDNISDKEQIAVIMLDGDKVFFRPSVSDTSDWYLMYDFGLQVGDGCYVYSPVTVSENSTPYKTYIKCAGIGESPVNKELSLLTLEEYNDDSCSDIIGRGTWIKGLSSFTGILYNNRFGIDGVGSMLLEVSVNDQTLYSNTSAGIVEITNPSIPTVVSIDDRTICVSVDEDICGSLYSQSGCRIGDYKFSKTPTCINLSHPGVYILRIGNSAQKVLIP